MKKIGIIGGLGPASTREYYRLIVSKCHRMGRGGGYPEIIIYSMNFAAFFPMLENGNHKKLVEWLATGVQALYRAGADFALMASNTPHIVFKQLQAVAQVPMISIVEETLKVVEKLGVERLALLGTKFTMQSSYYQDVFSPKGYELVVPMPDEQEFIHDKLEQEIGFGEIYADTRQKLLGIIKRMKKSVGIEAVILGCTELPLILTESQFDLPFINTTEVHADSAVCRACV